MSIQIVAIFIVLIASAAAVAATPATRPDAAALVREVRAAEAWIDKVDSLRLKVHGHWSIPAAEIERRKANYKQRFPQTELTVENFSDLRGEITDTLEIAFDKGRAFYRVDGMSGPGTFNHRVWDGKQAVSHEKYSSKQELYALDNKPAEFFDFMLSYLPWPRQATHAFWWTDPKRRVDEDFLGPADTYELIGREKFRDVDCYVVETPMYWRRLYIGVSDHHVYGEASRALPRGFNGGVKVLKEIAAANNHPWKDAAEYYKWRSSLPADQQKRLNLEYHARRLDADDDGLRLFRR